jgi:hypothetical protein
MSADEAARQATSGPLYSEFHKGSARQHIRFGSFVRVVLTVGRSLPES